MVAFNESWQHATGGAASREEPAACQTTRETLRSRPPAREIEKPCVCVCVHMLRPKLQHQARIVTIGLRSDGRVHGNETALVARHRSDSPSRKLTACILSVRLSASMGSHRPMQRGTAIREQRGQRAEIGEVRW